MRACVEMAKAWRMDKYLRRLEAIMIVCDANVSVTLTGGGDVIEPVDGIIGATAPPHPAPRRAAHHHSRSGRYRLGRHVRDCRGARAR